MTNEQFNALVRMIIEIIGQAGAYEGTVSAPRYLLSVGFSPIEKTRALLVTEPPTTDKED